MISRLRARIAAVLAIAVVVLTGGLVAVNRTGRPAAAHGRGDPDQARITEPQPRRP